MKESYIEHRLVMEVRRLGGLCPKFTSPGMDGMPDRLILMPEGKMVFCELKAPGERPRPLQEHRHEQLRSLGFEVEIVDSPEQIEALLERMTETITGTRRKKTTRETEAAGSMESKRIRGKSA